MRISELKINHYKSIEDPIYIRDISGLNILVGPNNAGKTNILDAIYTIFHPQTDEERFFDKNTDIELTLEDDHKKYFLSNKKGEISFQNEEVFSKIKKSFIRIEDTSSIYSLVPDELQKFKINYPLEYSSFSNSLKHYFKGVEISEELFVLSIRSDSKERSVKRMGEGFKRLFVILFYIFHPHYSIIFIDEPELHLHPSIIKRFLLLLGEKKKDNQIFITTHHPTFVQADYLPHIWRVARNNSGSTAAYRFSGENININRFVQEINDDNSGMLFADKVLLVEGVSDRIFMTEMINRFYKKDKDIKVVYTGGKGTIDLYASLCELFNIPYAVMLDSDAINSSSLKRLKRYPSIKKGLSIKERKDILKRKEIFILDRDLEHTYPKKYKRRETKPLSALLVSRKMTNEDIRGKEMEMIKEVLERI